MNRYSFVVFSTIVLLTSILVSSCKNNEIPNEPFESTNDLVVEKGYYSQIVSNNTNDFKYLIEFTYYVKGTSCAWAGYSIKIDSQDYSYSPFNFPELEPEKRYTISDTIDVANAITTGPLVSTTGYRVINSNTQLELDAEYLLQIK